MRLGDLDGLDVLYDRVGRPILADGEVLVAKRRAEALALHEGKRARGAPRLHHGQGDVLVVLTSQRLLVLVDPSLQGARRVLHGPGEESWTRGMQLFAVIQGRGRYYLELTWDELPKVRVGGRSREVVDIPVRPREGGPHLLTVDRETAAWVASAWRSRSALLA
jgi:hypothetical protein